MEKRVLIRLAAALPDWVTPDQLTVLGLLAMLLGGLGYAFSGHHPWLLLAVNLALLVNWFGDSLDGTLARYRNRCRPRYGFYVDHIVDAFGALFLLAGLAVSGLMGAAVVAALLVVYYLFSINMYLATHVLGRFRMSYGAIGGTELRILLALLNLAAWQQPGLRVLGHSLQLLDVAGVLAIIGLGGTLLKSIVDNTRELHRLERR